MHKFLKIATQMFSAERIEKLDRNANIGGELGIEVKLFGVPETFQYTGQYASLAWDVLDGINPATNPPAPTPKFTVTSNGVLINPTVLVLDNGDEYHFVILKDEWVNADDIEFVDFDIAISPQAQHGIEVRVATDAPGVTRTYADKDAEAIYDTLVFLASNVEEAATN
jgi:hypothetical protein